MPYYWNKVADENFGLGLGLHRIPVPGGWLYRHVMRVRVNTFWGESYKNISELVFVPLPGESRGDSAMLHRQHEWNMSDDQWYESRAVFSVEDE